MARAIAGVYGPNAFRGLGSPNRSPYFREHGGAFTVEPSVRSSVRFHLGNLLDPALFADRPAFDVVFCRNLLIYLDDEARARAFATLGRLIADGGLLFLGHADRVDDAEETPFEPTGDKGAFAFRKGKLRASTTRRRPTSKPSVSPLPLGEGPGVRGVARPAVREQVPGRAGLALPMAHDRQGKPCPTGKSIPLGRHTTGHDPHPGPLPGGEGGRKEPKSTPPTEPSSIILDRASSLADLGRYDEATALVEGMIRSGGAGAPAYFLLGLIAQAAGQRDRAEGHFLKAVYLDPQHDEALLALALLARRKGDIAGESAYRKRAERVLARKAIP